MARIYCSNCGKHVGAKSNFCPYCGAAQHGREAATYRAQAPQQAPATADQSQPEDATKEVAKSLPETLSRRHLSQNAIWSFFVNYLVATSILLLLLLVGIVFQPVIAGLVLAIYLMVLFIVANVVHRSFTFEVNHEAIRKDYGVIHKRHVTIPFQQIQNVNINRSLIDGLFGIAKIDIETAGSSRINSRNIVGGNKSKAEAHLPGLSMKDARMVHDLLLHRASETQS